MADLLKCSRSTINSLESGRLKMSEKMAKRMFHETEISPEWLLAGEASAPPMSGYNEPYSKAIFERRRLKKHSETARLASGLWQTRSTFRRG